MKIIFNDSYENICENISYFNYIKHKIKNIDYHYLINEKLKDDIPKYKLKFERTSFFNNFDEYQKTSSYKDIVIDYDWIIHYNIKNIMCEPNFIKFFFSLKKNLFVRNDFSDLYIISNQTLLDYISSDKTRIIDFEFEKEYSTGNLLIKKNNKVYYY
jgi:hypothetical protein